MFNHLTTYLLQYRRVSIPSVGTIRLVQQPSQLDVVEKLIAPPSFRAEYSENETVSDHQLNFLSAVLQQDRYQVQQSLQQTGEELSTRIRHNGFYWKGIGVIHHPGETVHVATQSLEPVAAERVLRADAEHSVLIGDHQKTYTHTAGLKEEDTVVATGKRSVFVTIGWIVLLLSILYIIFVLWQGKFRLGSTGSKQSPTGWVRTWQPYSALHLLPL